MNYKLIIILIVSLFPLFSFSQESLEETKQIADKLFEDEKYIEATPYYLRLLAIQPRDHNFNYHYGACLLYNAGKSQDVFKYLNYAITNVNVEAEANYFLGRAFHLNYQFNDAIKYYKIYQLKIGDKAKASFDVKRQIEMCENGKKLITTITEMVVLDKKEIEKDKFFRIYDLSDIGGNLLVTAEFQTKIDEKKAHIPLIHFPANPTVIYYSSYGESGKTGKDIYVQRRLPTGGWGLPQELKGDVNTKFDEDYPYMHPDGQYLYFSSKGHNSMGGFDVFRCKYDPETDMFGTAENMDFAVSSPNDDLFYVVDSLNKNAYFGSNRQSEEGKLFVYKVRVDRVPLNMSVIKGEFSSIINPQMKKVLIDVKDYASGEIIGSFNSNEKGVYLITFPKGGKYEFEIRVGENPQIFKYIASIPFQKEFKPLKQKIIHELHDERENIKVLDLFNEEVEEPQAVFAQVIRMKSVLTPNVSAEELARMDKELKDKEILKVLGLGNLSLVEVGYLLEDEVKDAKKAEDGTKEIENKIYNQVVENTIEINRLDGLIKSKIDLANTAPNDKRKYKLLKEAERALKIQEELKLITDKSLFYADSLSKNSKKGSSELTAEITNYSEHFKELLKENKQKEAYAYLNDNKDVIKKIIDEKTIDPLQELIDRGLALDDEIAKLQPIDDQYDKDLKKIDADIAELERSKNGAKKKEIEELDAIIKNKKTERSMISDERVFNGTGLNEKIAERSSIRKQVDILESIYNVKSNKVISKEELELAVNSSKTTNSVEVLSKITDQITQLVLTSPDVKEVDYEDLEKDLGSVVTNSKGKSDRIKADATLSPQEKANKLKALDRELLGSINNEILNTEKAFKQNLTDPQLKKKLESLQTAKTLVSSALDLPEGDDGSISENTKSESNQVEKTDVSTSNSVSTPSNVLPDAPIINSPLDSKGKESLIETVNSSYNEKLSAISSNSALSENEKLNQLQQIDKELITSLNKEISTVGNSLKSSPSDAVLLKKSEDLKTIKSEVESNVSEREKEIVANNSVTSSTPSSNKPIDAEGKESLIETVNSSYNEKLSEITSNSALSENEKLNQLQQIDKELITSLNKEISTVGNSLKSSPSDAVLLKKSEDLKTIKSEVESKVSAREKDIAANNSVTSSTPSSNKPIDAEGKESLIETVNSSYNEKLSEITSNSALSENEKLNQLQQIDKELITSLNKEILSVSNSLKTSPSDASLLKKSEDLKTIKSELETKISAREKEIAVNNSVTSSNPSSNKPIDAEGKESLIETVNSSYNEKLSEITSNSALSENEKLNQLQVIDKELITSLNKEILSVSNSLKTSPSDASLLKKSEDLKTIKSEVESKVSAREKDIAANNSVTSSTPSSNKPIDAEGKESLIETVNSSYNEKLSEITSNSALSENEKLNQLQVIDKELITSLNKEILSVSNSLKTSPSDANLLKKSEDLKTIKSELETKISAREKEIAVNNSVTSATPKQNSNTPLDSKGKESLIETVNSSYNEKLSEITSNSAISENEKLNEFQKIDKELITSLNKEILSVGNSLKSNPSDAVLLKKKEDLKTIKSEVETKISAREKDITANNSVTPSTPSSNKPIDAKGKESLIETVNSSYNEKLSEITTNSALSENEKLNQLQQIDKELITSLNKEILSVSNALKSKPSDAVLLKKKEDLKTIKSEVETKVSAREKDITANNSVTPSTPSSNKPIDAKGKESLIETVNSSYNEKLSEITTNSALSENEKLNQLQQIDKELITSLNKEILSVSNALKSKPSDAVLLKKKEDLKTIKSEVESKVSAREKDITANNSVTPSTPSSNTPLDSKGKESLIETVNSSYNEKLSEITTNSALSENEKLNQLQQIDKELITSLNKEVLSVSNALKSSPSDAVLMKKKEDLKSIKSEVETKISAREKDIAANNSTVLTSKEKVNIIEALNSSYNEKIVQINSNSILSQNDKLNQIQKLDKELVVSISNEISKTETALQTNSSDANLLKKEADLVQLKNEFEVKIKEQEISLSIVKKPLDSKVKVDVINSVNSKYDKTITDINYDKDLSVIEKLNRLQELDYSIVKGLSKEISSTEGDLIKNPKDAQLIKKLEDLNSVKNEVEVAISNRESVIASSGSEIDAKVKSKLIESLSSSYNEKVNEIKQNEYLLDGEKLVQLQELDKNLLIKLDKEIEELEKSLVEDPSNTVNKRKLDGLAAVKIDLENGVSSREKSISPSSLDKSLVSKSELIEKFNPEYNEKVANINGDAINTQIEKLEELQKLDQELLISIKEEVKNATIDLKKKPKDETLKKSKADINELQILAEKVLFERAKEIELLKSNSVSEKQKSELVSEIRPNYTSKIGQIKDSKLNHDKELQELINEEKALLEVLNSKEAKVMLDLKNNPKDLAIKEKLNIVIATKLESQSKIDHLMKQAVTLEAQKIDQVALISKVDPTFTLDIKKIEISNSTTKSSEFLAREISLQNKIKTQISENEKLLTLNFNLEKAAENQILSQKLKESKDREVEYNNGKITPSDIIVNTKGLELRKEVLGNSSDEINKEYEKLEELKTQENVVSSYIDVLALKTEKTNSALLVNPEDQELKDQKLLLESELTSAKSKIETIASKVETLENSTADNALSSPKLKVLIEKESSLKQQLENQSLSKKVKSTLEKELNQVQIYKSVESNGLITSNLTVLKTENTQKSNQLKKISGTTEISKVNADLAESQNLRLTQEADALITKSDKTKNPIVKNELLTQAIQKQKTADDIVQIALEDNVTRAAINNKVSTLDSKEELEDKKRIYSVEIGEIKGQIVELDTQIAGLKAKKAVELVKKKDALKAEEKLTEKQLAEVDRQLSEIKEVPKTISESAIKQDVSFGEEKRLIASKEYLEYSINANKALRIEQQIVENEIVLTQKRQAAKDIISMSLDKSTNITDIEVNQSVENVITVENEINKLTAELKEKQTVASDLLSKNDGDALLMQNLLKRGVEPGFNESLALVEQQREPAVGLKVVSPETQVNDYSENNPIPVDVKNPTGLVYRIQVGAFTKPIAQDMYKSFSPVSGEKLASGVTRYMAGYFNNSSTVVEAFTQVKSLGYSDAFIVAYCDDERIPLAEARKLELSGQCISTESREFIIALAATPAPSVSNTNDLSYNDAPGAAKAIPAEAHLGLFYTVQVGVYNKPATPRQLKNIDPIVSKRMPNGQIRYSSGMFSSIEAAKPKKAEAIDKGVKDAFITAYYRGERLTLSQAAAVLKKEGDVILEKIDAELLASVSNKENTETIKETSKSKEELSSYNKSPGAVSAKAVEAHLGLFFTVQIGVYSKPANSKQLNYVTPLITKKLPNGQLRYSSGMYSSIEAAEPKRLEILEKGVKHAYITAYYKGERITIAEAKELLSTNGDIILEKLDK